MLRWRLLLGTIVVAALVAIAWLDQRAPIPGLWLLPVAAVFTVLASQEMLGLARAGQLRPLPWTVYVGNLLILLANWQQVLQGKGREPFSPTEWPLLVLGVWLLVAFAAEITRYRRAGGVTANLAVTVFALLYVGLMMSFVVQLRLVWGIGALASLLLPVKMGDIGAYTVGRLIGRHKLAPHLSPGKTIEGAVGALIFGCVGSWACFAWLVPATVTEAVKPGPTYGWIVYGLLMAGAGMIGDLAESLLKRDVGVKDSSTWLPGFGGVLDMVDSVLLAAPLAWLCWALGWVGR